VWVVVKAMDLSRNRYRVVEGLQSSIIRHATASLEQPASFSDKLSLI
jgi:hypothetical protein